MIVKIPFSREMREAIRDGRKCCTTRREQKGEVGDMFTITGNGYRIIDVHEHFLDYVQTDLYQQEGCKSPEAFKTLWRSLHRGSFSPRRLYYVHWFARVEGPE